MEEIKLKPCPFCGSSRIKATARTFSVNGVEYTNEIVMCLDCQGQVVAPAKIMQAVTEYNETNGAGYGKPWPQNGDICYFVSISGLIDSFSFPDDSCGRRMKEFGNLFRTYKEAEAALERVKKALKGE